jgi:hypothetical protein
MNTCLSCKNKTSNERCKSKSINGLTMCGHHIKSKTPRLWHIVNNLDAKATLLSRMWRGHSVRIRLKHAGPGVLKRSICHNEEELVSAEPKSSQHPFEYFAFEEGGKVWWFDVKSILSCLSSSLTPTNPYTRQPLSIETRRRLRTVYVYRMRHNLPVLFSVPKRTFYEIIDLYWLRTCQVLHENGFEDVNPSLFSRFTKSEYQVFLSYIVRDMIAIANDHPPCLLRYVTLLRRMRDRISTVDYEHVQMCVASNITAILHDLANPYHFCFIVMSALHRL